MKDSIIMNDSQVNEPPSTPGDKVVTDPEGDLIQALGMAGLNSQQQSPEDGVEVLAGLEELRGVANAESSKRLVMNPDNSDTELEGLAELVPDVKARRRQTNESGDHSGSQQNIMTGGDPFAAQVELAVQAEMDKAADEENDHNDEHDDGRPPRKESMGLGSTGARRTSLDVNMNRIDSMNVNVQKSQDVEDIPKQMAAALDYEDEDDEEEGGNDNTSSLDDFPGSDDLKLDEREEAAKIPKEFMNMGSGQSISTATQTHEVRMPMYLPTFKPATGCTNASDFVVRCFVARLRAGITVVKHGRSRWCKSRLRVLHIHPDGRSLSWRPAEGEPTSSKRPPKLDLSTCLEVRHAWSPDPQNPMYTGTPILRQKCEAANAHKSFALIFKQRTVDITAVTADQCKVLMEGFSALCFRLQVANLAGRGSKKGAGAARPMPEEDGISVTASATLTNTSTPRGR